MVLSPAPQTFTTFSTFSNIAMFAIFAKFAKFAKFANFNPALEYPTLTHRHAPHLGSISEHAISTPHPPSPVSDGRGGRGVRA